MINFFKQRIRKNHQVCEAVKYYWWCCYWILVFILLIYWGKKGLSYSAVLPPEHNVFLCAVMFLSGRMDPVWEVGQTERVTDWTLNSLCICQKMELCHSPVTVFLLLLWWPRSAHIPSNFSPLPDHLLCLSSVEKETCSFTLVLESVVVIPSLHCYVGYRGETTLGPWVGSTFLHSASRCCD